MSVDSAAGDVSTPDATVAGSTPLTALQLATLISWSGATDAGPVGYLVQRSRDGGSYALVHRRVEVRIARLVTRAGHAYRFRVRAVGEASDAGAWALAPADRTVPIRERRSLPRKLGDLDEHDLEGRHGTPSSTKGATASYPFTRRKIA